MKHLDYLQTILKLKRNMVDSFVGEMPDGKDKENLLGRISAYNDILHEMEFYRHVSAQMAPPSPRGGTDA